MLTADCSNPANAKTQPIRWMTVDLTIDPTSGAEAIETESAGSAGSDLDRCPLTACDVNRVKIVSASNLLRRIGVLTDGR